MAVVIELEPLAPASNSRIVLRVAASDDRRLTALNGVRWWPGVFTPPVLTMEGWDGDFTTSATIATATFGIDPMALRKNDPNSPSYRWAGAAARVYEGDPDAAWSSWKQRFSGLIDDYSTDDTGRYSFTAKVDGAPFDVNVLTASYLGTGADEGGSDLTDKVKPMVFGRALNVEPVLLDSVTNVYQVHGYGPVSAIVAVYERAADLVLNGGANIGDFPNPASLVAADIDEGDFATCLAHGMFRLGAPPAGVITADVDGDCTNGFIRTTAAIVTRLCQIAGVPTERIDTISLAAFEAAVPYAVNLFLTTQITVIELVQSLVRPCNAQALISWTGQLQVVRFAEIPPARVTLDAQGRRLPAVLGNVEIKTSPPYQRIEMLGARCWRKQTKDEIAFVDSTAATTANWSGVVDDNGNKPDDNATNSADPASPFGPEKTVADALADVVDVGARADDLAAGAAAMVARAEALEAEAAELTVRADQLTSDQQSDLMGHLAANLILERLARRTEGRTHIDGIPIGITIRNEITQRTAQGEIFLQFMNLVGVKVDDAAAILLDLETLHVGPDESLGERLTSIATQFTTVTGEINTEIQDRETAIADEHGGRVEAFNSLQAEIDGVADDLTAAVTTLQTADVTEAEARAAAIATVEATLSGVSGDLSAAVSTLETAIADGDSANAEAISDVDARLDGLDGDLAAEVSARESADVDEAGARAAAIATVEAHITTVSNALSAAVTTLQTADSNDTAAWAAAVATVQASITGLEASLGAEVTARQSAITDEAGARAEQDALIQAALSDTESDLSAEVTARQSADTSAAEANATSFAAVQASLDTLTSDLASAVTTLEEADATDAEAWAAAIATVQAQISGVEGDLAAAVTTLQSADVTTNSALASAVATLTASISGVSGDLAAAVTALQSADVTESDARASDYAALTASISTVSNDLSSAVTTLNSAITDASGASADALATVSARVDDSEAAIDVLNEVVITPSGSAVAKAVVQIDVNGHVSGTVQTNDGTESSFIVATDAFGIVPPPGSTDATFEFADGLITIKYASGGTAIELGIEP